MARPAHAPACRRNSDAGSLPQQAPLATVPPLLVGVSSRCQNIVESSSRLVASPRYAASSVCNAANVHTRKCCTQKSATRLCSIASENRFAPAERRFKCVARNWPAGTKPKKNNGVCVPAWVAPANVTSTHGYPKDRRGRNAPNLVCRAGIACGLIRRHRMRQWSDARWQSAYCG